MYFSGLTGCPLYHSSKWRCGPVLSVPLFPTSAMASPPFTRSPSFFQQRAAVLVDRDEILTVLYAYHVTGFSGVGAQKDGAVHSCQHTFVGVGGNIRSKSVSYRC